MNTEPTGTEILFLWRLALAGGADWLKDIKPDLKAPARDRMEEDGLIEKDQRAREGRGRKQRYYTLTDRGWQWLSEHLDTPIQTRSPASTGILALLLAKLHAHLDSKGLSLAEFVQPQAEAGDAGRDGLDRRIESAYLSLSQGKPNVRVRLADLRDALPGIPREDLDATLLDLATSGKASLYPLDNPLEIGPRDRAATLRTRSGEERHVVYLGGRGS